MKYCAIIYQSSVKRSNSLNDKSGKNGLTRIVLNKLYFLVNFSFYVPCGKQANKQQNKQTKNTIDGKVISICIALGQLVPRRLYNKVVLLSDSIQAIGSNEVPISTIILDSRALFERLSLEG